MPQDITNQNDIPVMALTADISSQDVEIIMGLIKLLVNQRNGTASDEETMRLRDIKNALREGLLQHNLDQHNQLFGGAE
tara:strand:+ start:516 stop:752 length:237 start_codon:yes stop_codon:yes gene_type:complete